MFFLFGYSLVQKRSVSNEDFTRLPPKQDCAWEMKKTVAATKHHYFATSFMSEVIVLLHRNFINVFRTKELFLARVLIMVTDLTVYPWYYDSMG